VKSISDTLRYSFIIQALASLTARVLPQLKHRDWLRLLTRANETIEYKHCC